jgi:secreted PhoX family phosphatase
MKRNRRIFIGLLSKIGLGFGIFPPFLQSCSNFRQIENNQSLSNKELQQLKNLPFNGIQPSSKDRLILAEGLNYEVLISWGDPINGQDFFGFNNDFTCFIPLENNLQDGLLWVNHEYANPFFIYGYKGKRAKSQDEIDQEMYNLGGSIIRIKKEGSIWKVVPKDVYNRRITAKTEIEFAWKEPIAGSRVAIGTHSNCSGGITPWGSFLSCEENYQDYAGERIFPSKGPSYIKQGIHQWERFYAYPPEHYGWVVEIQPKTGQAKKLVALGRYSHECCSLIQANDGRMVAYSGDDKENEFIYKFVSDSKESLEKGTLFVANTDKGEWVSLDFEEQQILKDHFENQTEVLIRAREAARLVGATPQNRPEDIEIDPYTGEVFVALTKNSSKGDYFGSILKIDEMGDHAGRQFKSSTFMTGGSKTGLVCPDNMVFDRAGNLYVTSDMSTGDMNDPSSHYFPNFRNNALFVIPRHGAMAGEAIQIASAPIDAELTGPWFSPDYRTLFLSVQHPGENSNRKEFTSHWPANDNQSVPKPSVVSIQGPLLDKLIHLNQMVELE